MVHFFLSRAGELNVHFSSLESRSGIDESQKSKFESRKRNLKF